MEDDILLEEFITRPDTISLIIRYSRNLEEFVEDRPYMRIGNIIRGERAVVYVNVNKIEEILTDIAISRFDTSPSLLGLLAMPSLDASGILQLHRQPYLDLRGNGVLIGFIDTGIDYTKDAFIYEDGTSKIQYIWDQTISGNSPDGYHFGTEYTNEQINNAIQSENPINIVPHKDTVGHGTFLASIAAGREGDYYIGSAPDAELIIVKLKKAHQYYINRHLVPLEQDNVFESIDVMLGIEYMIEKANQLNRPLSICIGIGTNFGGHDSFSPLEDYLNTVSHIPGICVCIAVGNESQSRHHTNGNLRNKDDTYNIQIQVDENSHSFPVYLWNNISDRLSVSIKSPTGEIVGRIPAKAGTSLDAKLILEKSRINVQYFFPLSGSGSQLTFIKIFDPTPGIWTITVYGDIILDGTYHAWLPITGFVSEGVEFVEPTPNYTIVIPSTSIGCIACGAYDSRNNSLYSDSSWGPSRLPMILPDLVAPGVDVEGIYPINRSTMTGTSVAASITAGACALMLQWGIIQRNETSLDTYKIRAYMIRGCIREQNIEYPNPQWGYGRLNLLNTFNQLRTL